MSIKRKRTFIWIAIGLIFVITLLILASHVLRHTPEYAMHHINTTENYTVMISPDGHLERVYDQKGDLVTNPDNEGNYNYFHPVKQPLRHFFFDLLPWILWGNSFEDTTSMVQRIHAFWIDLSYGWKQTFS